MGHLRWADRPELDEPVFIAAFEGWNDAGDAATFAARHLKERWRLRPCGDIDPEDFFDFTATRPQVAMVDAQVRRIEWPSNELFAGTVPDGGPDVLLLLGTEPQLKWRTFTETLASAAEQLDARLVVTMGALLSEVPHTRPVPLVGTAHDPQLVERLGLDRSSYEGPTGIVGVLHDACNQLDLPSASLWAAVPTYVPGATSPKAALALVTKLAQLLGVSFDTTELEIGAATYERQINELVDDDEDLAEFVSRLEEHQDEADRLPSGNDLVAEVERFLRERPGEP